MKHEASCPTRIDADNSRGRLASPRTRSGLGATLVALPSDVEVLPTGGPLTEDGRLPTDTTTWLHR